MTIGEKIKSMRQDLGYTQEQLAEKLLVSRQAIAKWESNRGIPDIENLKTIAEFFGLSVDCLLNGDITLSQNVVLDNTQTLFEKKSLQSEIDKKPDDLKIQLLAILKNKKVLVPFVCILIGLIVLGCILPTVQLNANMKKAEALMNNGNYLAAAEIYGDIDTQQAEDQYNACIYMYAKNLYNEGKYEEAITQISNISYEDSSSLLKVWKYEFALYNVKNENYPKAIALFGELDEYNESNSKYAELCNYYGTKLYNEKIFNEAISYLGKVPKESSLYNKATELYNKALYNKAVDLHNIGEFGKAFNLFRDLIKNGNEKAAKNAKYILNQLLQNNMWNYSPSNNENTLTYIFSDFIETDIWNGKFYFYIVEPDGSHENSFSFTSKIFTNENNTDAEFPIVLMGTNTQNSLEIIFLSFDYFSDNSKVYIHTHFLSDVENCSDVCGLYIANQTPDLSSYTTKYEYDFEPVELPQLSFSQEILQIEKDESKANNEDLLEKEENNENSTSNEVEPNSSCNTSSTNKGTSNSNKTSNGTTSSKDNSNNTSSTNKQSLSNNQTSNTTSNTNSNSKPVSSETNNSCPSGHTWNAVTTKIHHEEQGHYEWVESTKAYTWYKCGLCSSKFNDKDLYYSHFDNTHTDSLEKLLRDNYTQGTVPAEYEKKWVIDKKAYDETIVTGYKCSVCGKTK